MYETKMLWQKQSYPPYDELPKPRIREVNGAYGRYLCRGLGFYAYGATPELAYDGWLNKRPYRPTFGHQHSTF